MHTFTVWAPAASSVDLVLRDGVLPLRPAADGWWERKVVEAHHGTDYAFSIDGSEPLPDPRSPWQPDGVHGFSRVFDADRFGWTDEDWIGRDVRGSVFYELHIGTFTPEGTLDAAAEHLDYLVVLGVEVVSLMPVAAFPGRHGWGYDGVHLYAVHEPYGGPEALQRFVDRCHDAGLAVCLDVVYNHLGPSGNHLAGFGPYFTDRHTTPWGPALNLDDTDSAEVRRWVCDNALRWFAIVPPRCLAAGRRPCAGRRQPGAPAGPAVARDRGAVRRTRSAARTGRRVRSERPTRRRAGGRRRSGDDRAVERRLPPRAAQPADRRALRVLRGLRGRRPCSRRR